MRNHKEHYDKTLGNWMRDNPQAARKHYNKTLAQWWKDHPEKRSEFTKKTMLDPRQRARQAEVGRRVLHNPEVQAKSLVSRMKNPVMMAGPLNHSGKLWRLRDPRGGVYEFVNLNNFLRENPHLFRPEDVIWVLHGRSLRCRASALRNLHPDRKSKRPFGHWKGWTWVSVQERRFNDGDDLLDRGLPTHQTSAAATPCPPPPA